jgi:type I restriction enzyme S subunit
MSAQMNVPKLRFPEFSGEWEEKKIADVLKIGSGKDYKHLQNGDIPVFGTGGYMTSVNECLYDGESVCIGRKGTIDKPMYFNGKFWTVDTLFYTHSFKQSIPKFIYAIFLKINWKQYGEATGVPSLSKSTIENIQITIPSSIKEQIKIANFLTAIDTKIDQLTKKQTLLKQYKKGVMQKLFSQELRFKADDGSEFPEWEEKNILEIANTSIGLVTTMTTSYATEGIPLIRNSDIKANKILCNNLIYLEPTFANKYKNKMFKENDIVTIHTGEVGISAVIEKKLEGALGFATLNTRIKNKMLLPSFVSWYFNSSSNINFAISMSTGDGRCNYNLKDFNRTLIPIPSFNEQTKIANFLTAINTKINLATKQLDATKQFKKALLQQMFV